MTQKKSNDIDCKNERVTKKYLAITCGVNLRTALYRANTGQIENSLDAMVHVKKQTNKKQQ